MGSLPEIDLSKAMEAVDGDSELLKELVAMFIDDYPRQMEEIQNAIEEKNSDCLTRTAHSLKGAVGNFGAKKQYDLAYQLEMIGKEERMNDAIEAYYQLENEMESLGQYFSTPEWEQNL